MIVMPGNDTGPISRKYFKEYPDKIGILNTPFSWKNPREGVAWALDNGCFVRFDEKMFYDAIWKGLTMFEKHPPLFIACPDVVGCHTRTLALWKHYYRKINHFSKGMNIAFVAQDGCRLEDVPVSADWIFIGGLDPWKKNNIHKFIGDRPVHVGRVNSLWMLEYCESIGVASVDGTGWMRARGKQYYDFINWFEGDPQRKLF